MVGATQEIEIPKGECLMLQIHHHCKKNPKKLITLGFSID